MPGRVGAYTTEGGRARVGTWLPVLLDSLDNASNFLPNNSSTLLNQVHTFVFVSRNQTNPLCVRASLALCLDVFSTSVIPESLDFLRGRFRSCEVVP